jgi:hypothetical protein
VSIEGLDPAGSAGDEELTEAKLDFVVEPCPLVHRDVHLGSLPRLHLPLYSFRPVVGAIMSRIQLRIVVLLHVLIRRESLLQGCFDERVLFGPEPPIAGLGEDRTSFFKRRVEEDDTFGNRWRGEGERRV